MPDKCNLIARDARVYVKVFQEDQYGNKGDSIWEDWIEKGKKKPVVCENSRIRYDYRYYGDDPLDGNVGATCKNDEDIIVP